jgi:hypothetical protein
MKLSTLTLLFFISANSFAESAFEKRKKLQEEQARIQKQIEQNDAEIKAQQEEQKKKLIRTYEWAAQSAEKVGDKVKSVARAVAAPVVEKAKEVGAEIQEDIRENERREDPKNYDSTTCKWAEEIPRRIIKAPSCGRTPVNICTGYVVCNQKAPNTGNFIRMTVCSSELCGENDAVACTEDQGYSSVKPEGVNSNTVSGSVRKIIQSGTGASKQ